jgi:hypothetical protein
MLHHFAGMGVLLFSYNLNLMTIGMVVTFIHDVTDIFVCIFKLTIDTAYLLTVIVTYILFVSSWVYFRIYYFPIFNIKVLYE